MSLCFKYKIIYDVNLKHGDFCNSILVCRPLVRIRLGQPEQPISVNSSPKISRLNTSTDEQEHRLAGAETDASEVASSVQVQLLAGRTSCGSIADYVSRFFLAARASYSLCLRTNVNQRRAMIVLRSCEGLRLRIKNLTQGYPPYRLFLLFC